MYPHRIRLRGPWDCEPLARTGPASGALPVRFRMTLPCRWSQGGLPDFTGRVRFRRRFGFPGRIDAHERVWLTFGGVETAAEVSLNGQFLGRRLGNEGPFEFEVTAQLAVRNELIVEVEGAAERGGLWGEVALEVRCTAYLRQVQLTAKVAGDEAVLQVVGELRGTCERPLELYLLLDGGTVAYMTMEATPEGQPFQITSEELSPDRWQPGGNPHHLHEVRLELVNGAVVWYGIEQTFAFR